MSSRVPADTSTQGEAGGTELGNGEKHGGGKCGGKYGPNDGGKYGGGKWGGKYGGKYGPNDGGSGVTVFVDGVASELIPFVPRATMVKLYELDEDKPVNDLLIGAPGDVKFTVCVAPPGLTVITKSIMPLPTLAGAVKVMFAASTCAAAFWPVGGSDFLPEPDVVPTIMRHSGLR